MQTDPPWTKARIAPSGRESQCSSCSADPKGVGHCTPFTWQQDNKPSLRARLGVRGTPEVNTNTQITQLGVKCVCLRVSGVTEMVLYTRTCSFRVQLLSARWSRHTRLKCMEKHTPLDCNKGWKPYPLSCPLHQREQHMTLGWHSGWSTT